ncbi:MAG: Undecaprenyl-phosphate 4-deoxy-4-formamido-L-arabinose transferase [Nitrosomonadaceae bacterium]|nr:Undecaprenyl-phosphate 4-deoxy-4-formamido-L-arabinose transferase [Nitrosomonadaceae bacterium]
MQNFIGNSGLDAQDFPSGLSIVIPVYNSAGSLLKLIDRLQPVLEGLGCAYELVLVNDGSLDGSWSIIRKLSEKYPWVRGYSLMRNYGQHNALLCGIRAAVFSTICTLDDDLQHPPEEIPRLLSKLNEGFDVVYGAPQMETHGWWRDLASQITKIALQEVMGAETARHASAFRVFRTQLRQAFDDYSSPFVAIDVLLTWGGARFSMLQVRHDPRTIGKSNYTFRKLLLYAINMLTGFSTLPLRVASVLGFAFTIFGGGVLIYVLARYWISGAVVPGFSFLASIIVIFSGVQLFSLGIIGEYLARMHLRSLDKPAYAIAVAA